MEGWESGSPGIQLRASCVYVTECKVMWSRSYDDELSSLHPCLGAVLSTQPTNTWDNRLIPPSLPPSLVKGGQGSVQDLGYEYFIEQLPGKTVI